MEESVALELIQAETARQLELIRSLFKEYERAIGVDLCFQNFAEELATLPGRYAPPDGRLYICVVGGDPVGCVALRRADHESGEMKRLYLRERFRGRGYGKRIAREILDQARDIGYRRVVLDTLPGMLEAQGIYASLGFKAMAPYAFNPIPGVYYLEMVFG